MEDRKVFSTKAEAKSETAKMPKLPKTSTFQIHNGENWENWVVKVGENKYLRKDGSVY